MGTENSNIKTDSRTGINYMHISARPGQPSTFWQGKSGRWYKKLKHAELDDQKNEASPATYTYEKSFWEQNKKTVLWCLGFVVIITLLMWLWRTGTITYHAGRAQL